MRVLSAGLIAFLLAAGATHAVLLSGAPYWATDYQLRQGLKKGGAWNRLIYGKPPRAGTTTVGLASPDTLGSRAYLDLSKGPLILTGERPVSCAYWSASVFAHNTDAVLVKSDRDLPGRDISIVLRTADQDAPVAGPVQASAVLPSPKGMLLLRCFMRDRTNKPYVEQLSREIRGLTLRPIPGRGS